MRKAIFIFIAIILVAASIDWIHSCAELKSHKEVFGRYLTYADMYEYKDKDYDYVVRVPSFFTAQPDSLQDEKGRMRFEYSDLWITVVIESHVMSNNSKSLKEGMDSLVQMLQATDCKFGSDCFILSGPQYEQGSRIDGYSYYSKVMLITNSGLSIRWSIPMTTRMSSPECSRKSTSGRYGNVHTCN